ncbi:signal peptidase II [uncultured Kocuria sp.]|uniref:signal peptidase II n=1 Tax=uncultured Kocuria sp. TaxID=259305 RepID=UPI0025926210|nr:signal peptidase II [uncultured Kocuria sp.]MCT1368451.1 signal peptidase II [Rothia sp. p3-SID1597]
MSQRADTVSSDRIRRPYVMGGVVMLIVLYTLDQVSKHMVVSHMTEGQVIPVVDGVLWWRFIRNPGAAFSMGESITWIFTIVMAVVACVVVFYLPRARSRAWILGLFGLLAGVLGNLTDRLFREPGFGRGHVVDFISVPHFAIFNVADSCITVSIVVLAILMLRGVPLDGRTSEPAQPAAEDRS